MAKDGLLPVVFGLLGDGFSQYPGRQMLMYAIAKHTPVVLMRRREHENRLASPSISEVSPNIFEVRNAFALRDNRIGRRFPSIPGHFDGLRFRKALRTVGIEDFVYWLTVAQPWMLPGMPVNRLVFDCVDPCFIPSEQARHEKDEFAICRMAKLVFCTARTLAERIRQVTDRTVLLPNACSEETADFTKAYTGQQLPNELVGRRRPFVGYMGTIDWRFDADAVSEAAIRLPDFTFVMVGRVNQDQLERVNHLKRLPNVIFTGSVSYEDGLAYTAAFDVGLIPFTPSPMNDAINPVKMYMYLAAGKPVVSTFIKECSDLPGLVSAARSNEQFAIAIREAVHNDNSAMRADRIAFSLRNTWAHRAEQAISAMRSCGLM